VRSPKHFPLILVYFLWASSVFGALFLARACYLDSFNVGWGDSAADHRHVVLWRETVAAIIVCLGLLILVAVVSRLASYCIAAMLSILLSLGAIGAHGPQLFRVFLWLPQLPGFLAAIWALGIHGDGDLFDWWITSINTILYAPLLFALVARRRQGRSA